MDPLKPERPFFPFDPRALNMEALNALRRLGNPFIDPRKFREQLQAEVLAEANARAVATALLAHARAYFGDDWEMVDPLTGTLMTELRSHAGRMSAEDAFWTAAHLAHAMVKLERELAGRS